MSEASRMSKAWEESSDVSASLAEVDELQLHTEIHALELRDGCLQIVALLAGDAHRVFLNRALHLELAALDHLDDLLGLLAVDAFGDGHRHLGATARPGRDLAAFEMLEADLAARQL